jgi:hypothetical protein
MRRLDALGNLLSSSGGTLYGTHAAIPAASTVEPGTIYFESDTGSMFRSDGASWVNVTPPSSGTQLDYAQITTSTAAISVSTEATAAAVITGNSVSYDGSKVKIEFYGNVMSTQVQATFVVLRDATVVGQATFMNYANNVSSACLAEMFDTPAAGAHTYAVKVFTAAGNSVTVKAGPGGSGNLSPAFLRVTKA